MSTVDEIEFNDQTDQSDNSQEDFDGNNSDDEYETIDVTENPLYHVLTAFFEDDEGNNVVDKLTELTESVNNQTQALIKTNENMTQMLHLFGNRLRSQKIKKSKSKSRQIEQ